MEKEVFLNKENALWRNAGLIFSQYSGLVQGYSYAAPKEMVNCSFFSCDRLFLTVFA